MKKNRLYFEKEIYGTLCCCNYDQHMLDWV